MCFRWIQTKKYMTVYKGCEKCWKNNDDETDIQMKTKWMKKKKFTMCIDTIFQSCCCNEWQQQQIIKIFEKKVNK